MARKSKPKEEVIPAKEVGSEVVEQAVQENTQDTNFREQLTNTIEIVKEATQELVELSQELGLYDSPVSEDVEQPTQDSVEAPTELLQEESTDLNTDVAIGEENVSESNTEPSEEVVNIFLKHVNIVDMAKDILYLAYLGGDLKKGKAARLRTVPYTAEFNLPKESYEDWLNRSKELEYDSSKDYIPVGVSSPDMNVFARKLVQMGQEGATIPDKKTVKTGNLLQVKLALRNPVKPDANIKLGGKRVKYSLDELRDMSIQQLRIVGEWYGFKGCAKGKLIKDISEKQATISYS